MTSYRRTPLLEVPSVIHFADRVVDDLADGFSTLVLLPDGLAPEDVWSIVATRLTIRGLAVRAVNAGGLCPDTTAAQLIAEACELDWASPSTPYTSTTVLSALQCDPNAPHVIALQGVVDAFDSNRCEWLSFLEAWVSACRTQRERDGYLVPLCMILPERLVGTRGTSSDVFLRLHEWIGLPSSLEMQMLCRSASSRDVSTPLAAWREHVLPSMAGSDVQFIDAFWDAVKLDMAALTSALADYAVDRGWDSDQLNIPASPDIPSGSMFLGYQPLTSLPHDWKRLWLLGAAGWTREYGLEVHTAALALLGRHDEVEHRLWRGQARLILPLIDQLRREVCRTLQNWFGATWATRWGDPRIEEEAVLVRQDAMASQWGHLEHILNASHERRSDCVRLAPLVSRARTIRNDIAHYRPVTFATFAELCREAEKGSSLMRLASSRR